MHYVVMVRGTLKGTDTVQSQATHDATIALLGDAGKSMGNISHRTYLNPQNPREFMAVDTWNNLEGMQKLMSDPNLAAEFGKLFDGQPQVTIWAEQNWKGW